ncbi:MAG: aspartate-ammonia lyase [Candidatus Moranbacteria bacterium]|nr:aspartate-ammonia lyase [Candidatus Moranbacteria bacterium]
MKKTSSKGIVGVSGEYFVAAELSQRGIVATLTLKNTPYIDILATNLEKGTTANIQVKTMSVDNNAGWRLGEKDGLPSNIKNHFYVLVDLHGPGKLPEYIIIPKKVLADFINKGHAEWLLGKKKDGSSRKNTGVRVFDPNRKVSTRKFAEKYVNNWSILDLW